jgi:hypothetical protein
MKNSGLKNEAQVAKIFVSGSDALPAKNSAGVRLFKQSDLSDGIISGKLIRPNYNVKELKKSIDTEIFELLPNVPAPQPDTVPRPVYNGALEQIDDLTSEVQRLNINVNDLTAKVSELEIVSESLKIEADNQTLAANIANDQRDISNAQVAETTIDLQNAIQNSINEAIQRVSLTARNEALAQENESLREQLFGLSAQTAEGAKSGANNNFTVKVTNPKNSPDADIYTSTSHNAGSGRVMSNTLEISNVTTDLNITNVAFTFDGEPDWFKVKKGATTIAAESSETYQLEYNNDVIGGSGTEPGKRGGLKPRRRRIGWKGKATTYKNRTLTVKVTFDNGSTDEVTLTAHLRKNRKSG